MWIDLPENHKQIKKVRDEEYHIVWEAPLLTHQPYYFAKNCFFTSTPPLAKNKKKKKKKKKFKFKYKSVELEGFPYFLIFLILRAGHLKNRHPDATLTQLNAGGGINKSWKSN